MTEIAICPSKYGLNLASAEDIIVIDATVYNKMTNDDDIVSNVKPTVDKINPCPHQSSWPGPPYTCHTVSTLHWHWSPTRHHSAPIFVGTGKLVS